MSIALGNRLADLRRQHNYSQDDIASKLNVSHQAVSKWERGEATPDIDNLIALSKIYGCTLDDLVNVDKDIKKPEEESVEVEVEVVDKDEAAFEQIFVEKYPNHQRFGLKVHSRAYLFASWFFHSFVGLAAFVTFIVLGCTMNLWHPGWLVFLAVPVISSIWDCISHRTMKRFCYPVLVLGVYLLIGILFKLWHPYWFLFLTIPLYYALAEGIDILIGNKKQ